MPDIWMDVDTALSEVPINKMPLIDDGDFKAREESVTYNQAGLDLLWNFITTAGVFTQTAVTPTDTAGVYDWVNQGNGLYTIEIPASAGGTINNDAEGFGWFSGYATGILPWIGPTIGFRAAALNNALIDGGDTLDVNVTAEANIDFGAAKKTSLNAATTNLTAITGDKSSYKATGFSTHNAAAVKTAIEVGGSTLAEILADTGTTLETHLTDVKGATFSGATDSLEAIRNRGDAAWAGAPESVSGTIAVSTADTVFDLTATLGTLSTADDTYNNMIICILDNSGSVYETARITDYDGTGLTRVTIDHELTFPVQNGVDTFVIYRAAFAPVGAASITEGDKNDIADKVWDEDTKTSHQTKDTSGYFMRRSGGRF